MASIPNSARKSRYISFSLSSTGVINRTRLAENTFKAAEDELKAVATGTFNAEERRPHNPGLSTSRGPPLMITPSHPCFSTSSIGLPNQRIDFTSGIVKRSASALFLNKSEINFLGNESLEAFVVRARRCA